jgi:putative hemolysin
MELINPRQVWMLFSKNRFIGQILAWIVIQTLGLNKINRIYNKYHHLYGLEFLEAIQNELNLKINIDSAAGELSRKEGLAIISNHPYGAVESIILLAYFLPQRPDIKTLGNFLITRIEPMKDLVFPVNPLAYHKKYKSSTSGIKQTIQYLGGRGCVLIFPSGQVSTRYNGSREITDRPWDSQTLRVIKNANVPVLPVYFEGTNSESFHWLGKVHPVLRTARIPHELLRLRNRTINIRIGKVITPEKQNSFTDILDYSSFLRQETYKLARKINNDH